MVRTYIRVHIHTPRVRSSTPSSTASAHMDKGDTAQVLACSGEGKSAILPSSSNFPWLEPRPAGRW
jgi:hypothetical protein